MVLLHGSEDAIPGMEYNEIVQRVLGQRLVTVGIFNEEDAQNLLSMPPFPVKLIATSVASTPREVVTLLRERLGPSNVQ